MGRLTRYERDALVGGLTAFMVSFLAGVFGYTTATGEVYLGYATASGLLMLMFGVYLIYRVIRRGVRVVHRRVGESDIVA